MKASRIGEIAKIKPALMNGNRFIGKVYGALARLDQASLRTFLTFLRQENMWIKKEAPDNEGFFVQSSKIL